MGGVSVEDADLLQVNLGDGAVATVWRISGEDLCVECVDDWDHTLGRELFPPRICREASLMETVDLLALVS
jgi:hypothetical protein